MKRSDKQKFNISEFLFATFAANCENCNKREEMLAMDLDEAADGFYAFGWRVKGERLLCKRCVRKVSKP